MIQGYSIYNLLLLGHKVAPYSLSVCFSTLMRVIAILQINLHKIYQILSASH